MRLFNFIILLSLSYSCITQNNIVTIKGNVKNIDFNEVIENARINLKLSGGYTFSQKTDVLGNYEFKFSMDSPSSCTISIVSDKSTTSKSIQGCFLASNDKGIISELNTDREYIKDFKLNKVYDCGGFYISPIAFNLNSIISCNDSLNKIDSTRYDRIDDVIASIYKILIDNPTMIIEFQGHGSTAERDVEHLSLYRAQLIKEIFAAKGIDKKRIETKGWGSRKTIVRDDIIKKAKTYEEKMALHFKNQRVVFRIVSWDFVKQRGEEEQDLLDDH